MNFKHLAGLIIAIVVFASCGSNGGGSADLKTELDSVSYFIGYDYGSGMYTDMGSIPGNEMNFDAIGIGFFDGLAQTEQQISVDDRTAYLNGFFTELREAVQDSTNIGGEPTGNTAIKAGGLSTVVKDRKDSVCYVLGYQYGHGFTDGLDNMPGEPANVDLVAKGFKLGITNDTVAFTFEGDIRTFLMTYFQRIEASESAALAEETKKEMQTYLDANKVKDGVIVTESGLQYEILKVGTGKVPTETDRVKVHYHGTTIDGNVFDSSVDRGTPAEFGVTQVIPGWVEALQLMPVGSKWKLTIPSDLAYGDRGAGANIGPGAALIFEVELLEIVN